MNIAPDAFTYGKKNRRLSLSPSPTLLSLAAILVFALIFWWAHVMNTQAQQKQIAGSNADIYVYHLPVREYGFSQLKAGNAPLWNPYTNCGMPFLATYQAALFYPLNFPHLFLPPGLAVSVIYLIHIFLAGLFMFLWMREIGAMRPAATFAATAYMLCSFVSYVLTWPHIMLSHAWIPLIFYLIHRTFYRATVTDAALLGVAVSCQFLAGYMQGFVYTLYGAFAYLIFVTLIKLARRKEPPRFLGRSFGFTLLGLAVPPALLTAFQWIPTLQLSVYSSRPPGGLTSEAILFGGSLYPSTFLAALINPDSYKWAQYALYPGMLTLALAGFAFVQRARWREVAFFFAMAAVSALIAFGKHTPLFDLYLYFPTGDWFRLPNRLLILTAFAVATLGGLGCNYLTDDILAKPGPFSKMVTPYMVFVGICAVLIWLAPASAGLYVLILLIGCLISVRLKSGRAVGMLAILLVGADLTLYVFNPVTYPWITPAVFPDLKQEKEFLRANVGLNRIHVFHAKNDWKNFLLNSNFGLVERLRETSGYESLSLQRFAEFCAYLDKSGEPSYDLPFTGSLRWTDESVHPQMLNILGARYIVEDSGRELYPEKTPPNQMPKGFKLKRVFSGTVNIYENPDALPRAFFTTSTEVIYNGREVLQRLADSSFDYRNTILLEEPVLGLPVTGEPAATRTVAPQVDVKPQNEGCTDILANVPAPGFIFLDDVYMPGWRATVDGKDAKIFRADYLFMAIPVGTGKHTIQVKYTPMGFYTGKWISFASAVLLVFLLTFDIAHRQAKKSAPWEKIRLMGRRRPVKPFSPVSRVDRPAAKQQTKQS